jgi:hypothetical protein
VITTNFNRVIEDAWSTAHAQGYSRGELIAIRTDEELQRHVPKSGHMRLFKPHGCLSMQMQQKHRMVLTSQDYCESRNIRPHMYKEIDALVRECTTVFAGYSLADYTFRNTFYQKHREMTDWSAESFCVGPVSDPQRYAWQTASMRQLFRTTLINDCFDTFLLRLASKRSKIPKALNDSIETHWAHVIDDNGLWAEGLSLDAIRSLAAA